jgi:hypothetical protein
VILQYKLTISKLDRYQLYFNKTEWNYEFSKSTKMTLIQIFSSLIDEKMTIVLSHVATLKFGWTGVIYECIFKGAHALCQCGQNKTFIISGMDYTSQMVGCILTPRMSFSCHGQNIL